MPRWLFLIVGGVVLAVGGFAGLGHILLWVGAASIVIGLGLTLLGWRARRLQGSGRKQSHNDSGTSTGVGEERSSSATLTWQRRIARLGWVATALATASAVLFGVTVWTMATGKPSAVPDDTQPFLDFVGDHLLFFEADVPGLRLSSVLGLALFVAALLVGLAALQAATAMQVLSRRRPKVDPVPGRAAAAGPRILGRGGVRALELNQAPEWPDTAIPPEADQMAAALRCTVLIPAHNEEAILAGTIASLRLQTRAPDRVLVVADNCTDNTVQIAYGHGLEVFETVGNTRHKGGALNQALTRLLADSDVEDVFVVMDADSTITPDFLDVALRHLQDDPDLMAVGGLFSGEEGAGVLGQMQRNEFSRYQRVIERREGRLFVLTGTASVFRGYAMQAVAQARGTLVPGIPGEVYDTLSLTEDNEITIALKSLGAGVTSPPECRVTTEVMPTWGALWRQRSRWQRGAVENVAAYGFTRTTMKYWAQQLVLGYGVVAFNAFLLLGTIGLLASDHVDWSTFWVLIGLVFLAERIVTAWRAGWRGRAVAACLVMELGYSLYLQFCFVAALWKIVTGRQAHWNYVPRSTSSLAALAPLPMTALVLGWSPLPASVLTTAWFESLTLFVSVNTLIYATKSVFEMLPPIVRSIHRLQRGLQPVH